MTTNTDISFAMPQETASLNQLRDDINRLFRQVDISRCEKEGLLGSAKMPSAETREQTRRMLWWQRTSIVSIYSERKIILLAGCVTNADNQLALLVRNDAEETTLCSFVQICGTTADGAEDPFAVVVRIEDHVDMFEQIRDALRLLV